ncbi:DUF2062 domain-containing protein [Gillisia sp. M10.2A]|uniref:DUF2062 domain-containing protein n=1 Tax=Gillisia lutea TaxID=2909668 RepID=A0ABS9EH56_9FLAO|nr:DUF2062 domain-containing protein [Gillisia lutea]MCF4101632.1 DUF2062 domain-containing protein [Gillisia lutea]
MNSSPIYQSRFDALKCCIIIPTYNNEQSLGTVIENLLAYSHNLIIINDGSTDGTKEILTLFSQAHIIHLSENRGKGTALKTGFEAAEKLGFEYAISIDSDGQHYPDDLDVFLTHLERKAPSHPEILLVGDRNMGGDGIPGKSTKGNRFSNFWYLVVTGSQLHDTQSGYRLYPIKVVNQIKLYTRKFELEIEVIVKASWRNVEVKNVPIKVLYPENRVTHFRPFMDITRIVLLYMWFVLVSFFYIHPRNKYQDFKEKGFKRFWNEDILRSQEPPHKKAAAIALGIFVGISPLWGLHTMMVFLLAAVFKVNKVIAFLFSNISIPPFIPFIIYGSYQMGSVILGKGVSWSMRLADFNSTEKIVEGLGQYIIGSISLAIVVSLSVWIIFYFLFSMSEQKQMVKP